MPAPRFFGDVVNGLGVLALTAGEHYIGDWQGGKRHGHGTWVAKNGDTYVGEWREGLPHGQVRRCCLAVSTVAR